MSGGYSLSSYSSEGGGSATGFGSSSSGPVPDEDRIFATENQRHDDLKNMLESSKDNMKLEAMRRTIGMVAKGRNVADLFPHVVKNVLTKNNELKKLVYVYLVRYAEEEQDLALLSISAFQRALRDPNQLIRASALRVLSSIRVPVIVPIMMVSIKESSSDMSPFVRKTAAHAIPKLYSLDETQKESLVEVIEKLLKDQTTLVAGSAVMAFELVCPERIDLIHKNYRKLCNLMPDVDEWGQVAVIGMLTRYARSQFLNPNTHEDAGDAAFYSETESEEDEEDEEEEDSDEDAEKKKKKKKKPYTMDADHRLLLRCTKPLLQSRNSAVVMAVCQLYFHLAPMSEISMVVKPMLRLLRSHREVQTVVLTNIATLSLKHRGLFEPFIQSFFVHSHDPTHIRNLKLEILTNVATESSVSTILREFQTYVSSPDRDFVASTIHAIGRCASRISDVTESCVSGLVRLLQHHDESVVGESVVIIKKLLQLQPEEHKEITVHLTKLADSIKVPMARASILWLIGEYSGHVPKLAPDVLRKMAKSFPTEEDIVKLQILNLSGKLLLSNPKQTKLLCQYVFNMGKYDINYDIRDRARFLRQLLLPAEKGALSKHAKKVLLAAKPPPVLESAYKDRQDWQVGSLSHMLNQAATGYQPLPDFPEEAPDPSVRDVEVDYGWGQKKPHKPKKTGLDSFYDDDDSEEDSDDEDETDDSDEEDSDEYDSDEDSEEEQSDEEDEEDEESDEEEEDEEESEEEDSDESEEEESDDDSSDEEQVPVKPVKAKPVKVAASKPKAKPAKQEESLLLLDDFGVSELTKPAAGASLTGVDVLQPTTAALQSLSLSDTLQVAGSTVGETESHELLHRVAGRGLQATYRFMRRTHLASEQMVNVEVTFTNQGDAEINDLAVGNKKLEGGMVMTDFHPIASLEAGGSQVVQIGIDFKDTLNPASFELSSRTGRFPVKITPCVGELLQGVVMAESEFDLRQGKLRGMNESTGEGSVSADADLAAICRAVLQAAGLATVNTERAGHDPPSLLFAGQTVSGKVPVLLTLLRQTPEKVKLTVNCEKMVISSMLVKEMKAALKKL